MEIDELGIPIKCMAKNGIVAQCLIYLDKKLDQVPVLLSPSFSLASSCAPVFPLPTVWVIDEVGKGML